MLLAAGADPQSTDDEYGLTPLIVCSMNGADVCAASLLAAGADAAFVSPSGASALIAAVQRGHVQTVALLLKTGKVHPLTENLHGASPWSVANEENLDEVVAVMENWLKANNEVPPQVGGHDVAEGVVV